MSDASQGPGWWQATDGKWYPPEALAAAQAAAQSAAPAPERTDASPPAATADGPPAPGWWKASDGNWYPPAEGQVGAPTAPSAGAGPAAAPSMPAAVAPGVAGGASVPPVGPGGPSTPAPAPAPQGAGGAPGGSKGGSKGVLVAGAIFVVLVLVVAVGFVVTRKSDSTASSGDTQVAVGNDDLPRSDIALADDTVVVRGNGGKTLKSFDPSGSTMTLDAGVEGVDKLAAGKVLVLTGVTAIKVKSVEKTADGVVVTTEPATLPEVIKDGDLSWDNDIDPASGSFVLTTGGSGGGSGNGSGNDSGGGSDGGSDSGDGSEDPTGGIDLPLSGPRGGAEAPVFVPDGESAAGAAQGIAGKTIKGKVGPLDGEITYEKDGKGATLHVKLTSSADVAGTIDIDVKMNSFHNRGHASVAGSKTKEFEVTMDDYSGNAVVETDLKGLQNVATIKVPSFFKLPFSVSFPAPVGGIPFAMTLSGTIQVDLSMALNEASLKGRAEVTFSGDAGFAFKGGSASLNGKRIQDAPDLLKTVQGIANGPVGIVVTTELPKVGFGFSFLQTGAEVYISNGLVASQTILPAPAQCTAMNVAYVLAGGVSASFLGKEIEIARKAFVKKEWNYQVPNDKRCNKAP
jgi:hypothetical protein